MLDYEAIIEQQFLDQSMIEQLEHDSLYALDDDDEDYIYINYEWSDDDVYLVESYDTYDEEETRFTGTKIA